MAYTQPILPLPEGTITERLSMACRLCETTTQAAPRSLWGVPAGVYPFVWAAGLGDPFCMPTARKQSIHALGRLVTPNFF